MEPTRPGPKLNTNWVARSLTERACVHFRVRFIGNIAVASLVILIEKVFGLSSAGLFLFIVTLDTVALLLQRFITLRGQPGLALWISLTWTALLGTMAIFWGGGAILLSINLYLLLILISSMIFLNRKATVIMAAITGGLYSLRIFIELSQIVALPHPGLTNLLKTNPAIAILNILGGYLFILITVVLSGESAEYLGRWSADIENEVKRKTDELHQALQNEKQASADLRLISNVNQLIVRKNNARLLFQKTCQFITETGYKFAWIGVLQPNSNLLDPAFSVGSPETPTKLPESALQAIQTHTFICDSATIALPIARLNHVFGVLILPSQASDGTFREEEIHLLQELADDLAYALENIKTEKQRSALSETAASLLTARNETEFWPVTLQAVQAVLQADRAAIYIYDASTDQTNCLYSTGLSQEYVDEINRRFREAPGARLLNNHQPVIINDTASTPLSALFRREGIYAYALFPLLSAQKIFGAFAAYRNSPHPFAQSDIEAGQTLAHLVAASLQNARLFSETRAKASEQAALYAAAQDMASSLLNPPTLLKTFANHLAAALDATSVYVLSIDINCKNLKVLAEYWSEAALASEQKSDLGRTYQADDYPFVQNLKAGKTVAQHAHDLDLCEADRLEFIQYGVKSKLFVPLLSQGHLVGHTEIWESRRTREFTQHEIHLAQAMSVYAAGIIENARLFETMEQREAYFRALIENSAEGVAIFDNTGILQYVAPAEKRLTGTEAQELIGKSAFANIYYEDIPLILQAIQDSAHKPNRVSTVEYRLLRARHGWQYFEATIHDMRNNPHVNGVVINYRDISQRKQAEAKIQHQANEIIQAYDATLEGWARALELRDKDTEGHTRRVTELALKLAHAMNLPKEQLIHLQRGAILHDIGKVAIPDAILHKTGPLSNAEQEIMREHPIHAYKMLSAIPFLQPALNVPYCHHEKWDGTGYPRGLKGAEIPIAARIFSIVDVWDALTSDRPYRAAWEPEKALNYIKKNSGSFFDPHIVKTFLAIFYKE